MLGQIRLPMMPLRTYQFGAKNKSDKNLWFSGVLSFPCRIFHCNTRNTNLKGFFIFHINKSRFGFRQTWVLETWVQTDLGSGDLVQTDLGTGRLGSDRLGFWKTWVQDRLGFKTDLGSGRFGFWKIWVQTDRFAVGFGFWALTVLRLW